MRFAGVPGVPAKLKTAETYQKHWRDNEINEMISKYLRINEMLYAAQSVIACFLPGRCFFKSARTGTTEHC